MRGKVLLKATAPKIFAMTAFFRRNSRRVSVIGVVPHAVGPSSERLNPTLYESMNKLDARKLFLGRSSQLLDFLHQGLCDLHLLFRELMPP
jgi:hypothetical protein